MSSPTLRAVIETVGRLLAATEGLTVCHDPPAEPPATGVFDPLPPGLHPELAAYLQAEFPTGLYRHQREALDNVLSGRHTVVATRTSSGKSLIYSVPVADRLLAEPDATALFLFPQKALANDQLGRLGSIVAAVPALAARRATRPHLIARYDGATEKDDRPAIRDQAQVLLTNPDMLHYSVLAFPGNWDRFLAHLRYVVVDECHDYRGIFGTNVAYLFRRLLALCKRYGSAPSFVATSATVLDPAGHMTRLTGLPFAEVGPDRDGSAHGARKVWMACPAEDHPYDAGRKLTLALADAGLTVLTFCPSRTGVERMLAKVRDKGEPAFVRVYRAGLRADEREEIERGLKDRTVRAVFSTSALELGIDIGAIDVVVCVGLPHTMMSLWQRAGRAGRAGKDGAVVLIPGETPIDAYYADHPRELFDRGHEPLVLNLTNPRVLHLHYACAVKEAGGDEGRLDTTTLGQELAEIKAGRDAGRVDIEELYIDDPHRRVRVRGAGDEAYKLLCEGDEIGDIDPSHLLREAPRNGIYRHGGTAYRVKDVSRSMREVRLTRERSPNSTTSAVQTSIKVRRLPVRSQHARLLVARVVLEVNEYLVAVTEKNPAGKVVHNWTKIGGMPNARLPTEGTMLRLDPGLWDQAAGRLGDHSARAALDAVARLFGSLFPTVTGPCDAADYSAAADCPRGGPPAVYLYDRVPYGVGLAAGAFDRMADLVARSAELIQECSCDTDDGCFRCVKNPHAEVPASKAATSTLLGLLAAELVAPGVLAYAQPDPGDPGGRPPSKACPTCSVSYPEGAKFCGNCGTKLEIDA